MVFRKLNIYLLLVSSTVVLEAQQTVNLVVVVESSQLELPSWISSALRNAEQQNVGLRLVDTIVPLVREQEIESYDRLCAAVSRGVSLIVDLSWFPWQTAVDLSDHWGIPLIKSEATIQQMVAALDQYLDRRNATDAALIFQSENEVDQGLYQLIGRSSIRVWVHAGLPAEAVSVLRNIRPSPQYYAIIGDTAFVDDVCRKAVNEQLVTLEMRWNLVTTDYQHAHLDLSSMPMSCSVITADRNDCCRLLGKKDGCTCPQNIKKNSSFLSSLMLYLAEIFSKLQNELGDPIQVDCNGDPGSKADLNITKERLYRQFSEDLDMNNETLIYWDGESSGLYMRSHHQVSLYNDSKQTILAAWSANEEFQLLPTQELQPVRRFFRIGTTSAIPWTYAKLDPDSGQAMFTEKGQPIYEGYCIDLIQKLSEEMDFDYEIVTPRTGTFGRKLPNGTWDGIVGDLSRGETDMAVAALIMTAEREEVIDFVAPYFEQTGILIVIRKAVLKTSLFKFMTVLRTEVWLSIVAALVVTGFMIWFLDKYSPYSARNDPDSYPYPCRQFTLKESFWFALTSFTPQGGGEAPKALSGRTLVAAYWLFVVLMLATFTANLAAFLTVERMQTPVSSLEQLGRQSRINYTVVEGSTVHQYFINMKFAEDTLYRVWKEITLNATSDQSQYRVWDYPVREQYGHILLAINASGPVPNASVGFRNVLEHPDADYAFIHDSAQIKYEVTRNCNLTEVGEIFAEQPYAVAVQQGSHLQEEMSRRILDLQKDRYLEFLTNKYWNSSVRGACPDSDESEGITLESVGGVFIATLFGLGLAMVTLVWEVIYYKRRENNRVRDMDTKVEGAFTKTQKKTLKFNSRFKLGMRGNLLRNRKDKVSKVVVQRVTIGDSFKPVTDPNKQNVFYMS